MAEERRLNKVHKTTALALSQRGQELERQIQEVNAAIQASTEEWAKAYGLPEDMNYTIRAKEDGELYLVATPKPPEEDPAESPEPVEEDPVELAHPEIP